jgi:flagellar basal-body rod protein FlgG
MLDALTATEASMLNDVERMRAISHNLANVSTAGFKREMIVSRPFTQYLNLAAPGSMPASAFTVTQPQPAAFTDHRVGTLKFTANPLDVAMEGNGYFTVMGESGPLYTRQGNFHLDAQGRLVTASGLPVLGKDGEIRLNTPQPVIDSDGNVFEGEQMVAQLQVAGFPEPDSLIGLGQGLYSASEARAPEQTDLIRVRQGYLEASNVALTDEMIRMIETVRHFESSQRVLQSYDSMLDKSINIIGEF